MRKEIEKVLKEEIAPELEKDGGGIELIDVRNGIVYVRLLGACIGCPMAALTMSNVVEAILKKRIRYVKKVEVVP